MDFKNDEIDEKIFTYNTEMDKDVSFSMIVDKASKTEKISGKTKAININNDRNESSDEDFEDKVEKMISETPPDPFMVIQSRTRSRWVEDANVSKCKLCNGVFGMFFRRHHCLLAGTQVTLSNGTSKKIEDIKRGDLVLSWNFDRNVVETKMTETLFDQGLQSCLMLRLENNQNLISTSNHRLLTVVDDNFKWVMMKDLTLEHNLVYPHSKGYSLHKITKLPEIYKNGEPQQVYDISVPGNTSFIANGIVSHNCRNCGDVFCGTCSNYWNTIPDSITHIPTATGIKADIDRTVPVRLCKPCDEKINLVKKLEILLKSVQIVEMDIFTFKTNKDNGDLSDSFIKKVNSIPDINNMSEMDVVEFAKNFMNGKLWKQLSNFYLSKFREIQYKLPDQDYSEWEKTTLWANYKYLKGHDVWMVHTIKAFAEEKHKLKVIVKYFFNNSDNDDVIIKDRDECWDRMCTRMCQQKLSWENSLLLLDIKSKTVMKEIVNSFSRCDDSIIENILPILTHKLIYDPSDNNLLMDFVIRRCSSKRIASKVYWSFVVEKPNKASVCDYLISKLFRSLDSNIYENIMKVNNFVKTIEENHSVNEISNLDKIKVCVSPTRPDLDDQTVCGETFPGEISANRPIPIILSPGCELENVILYKSEDLRTDLIVMSIIRLMKVIIEDALKIDLHVVSYDIQPTSLNTGFIGAVGKSQTLYKIEETLQITLANYIKKNNPDVSAKELSERFSRSCAFYSVMTFLLGIGDRHLDNIMLTERGELFHIDYGFILGKDPRPMKSPYMRISEGMLDAIGGYHSEEYVQFKDLCYQIYDISRRHVNTFVSLLSLLPKQNVGGTWTNPKISDSRVLREIIKRFAPGETYEKAKSILDTRIDKSTNMTNRSKYHIVDFFHRHNKEGTIRNIVSTTVGYGISGTSNLISGIWDYVSGTLT